MLNKTTCVEILIFLSSLAEEWQYKRTMSEESNKIMKRLDALIEKLKRECGVCKKPRSRKKTS